MKKILALVLALVMVIGLVACGAKEETAVPAATEAAPAATEATPKEEAPEASGAEDYTLRISSIPADVVTNYIELAAEGFREKYPDFKVEIVTIPYEDYVPQAPRVLGSADNAFDMCWIQREQHWKTMADEGMFMVINDLYEEGNWVDAVGAGVADLYKNANGDYVGVCDDIVWIGNVFYNPAIFEELNIAVPTTYEELVAACETIKSAGYIPMASAGSKHLFYTFAERMLSDEDYNALCDPAKAEAIWTSAEMVKVMEEFKDFSVKYLQEGHEGESNDAAAADLFVQGKAAMLVGINALEGNITATASENFDYGYFCFPNANGKTGRVLAFAGNSMEILASTDQPELCKEFLAYYMSVEMQSALAESGWLWPSRSDLSSAVVDAQPEIRQQQLEDMATRGSAALVDQRFASSYLVNFNETIQNYLLDGVDAETAVQLIAEGIVSE